MTLQSTPRCEMKTPPTNFVVGGAEGRKMFVAEIAANIRAQMFSDHSAVTPQKFRRKLMASLRVVFIGIPMGAIAQARRVCAGFFSSRPSKISARRNCLVWPMRLPGNGLQTIAVQRLATAECEAVGELPD